MLEFLKSEILESKAFRNSETMQKYNTQELSDIFFTMMLTLQLLSISGHNKEADYYSQETLKYPMFERVYLSCSDMANIISTLRNAKDVLDNKINIDIPILELKRYLRDFKYKTMDDTLKRMLFVKLQNKLKIRDSNLTTLRREILDGSNLTWGQKKRFGEKLYQILRRHQYKCDLLVLLQKFMDCREEIVEHIIKLPSGKFQLRSIKKNKEGKTRNLGTFDSRKAAEKHEMEVKYFKNK